jgi:glycosyltransferase involved in cell wall biosynthesis
MKRLWSINGRFLGREVTGVDRYAREIIGAMDSLISERHPLTTDLKLDLLCRNKDIPTPNYSNISVRCLPNLPGHIWEQLILPAYTRGGLLSLCNTGPVMAGRQIVCIHDQNIRLAPESYGLPFRTAYRILQPVLGWRAQKVVTVSCFSKDTIIEFGVAPAKKIEVIYDGYEHVGLWRPERSSLNRAELPPTFVLVVGSRAPHKNLAMVSSIAEDLARKGIHVLTVGGVDSAVFARGPQDRLLPTVKHLGRVDDDTLALLYQSALCLVFPSRTEGFGVPVLEAMALGCPIVSSNAASLPEVCGEAALYASPDDRNAWLAAITRISEEPSLRKRLSSLGLQRSKRFSWCAGAEKFLELMFAMDSANLSMPVR